MGAHFHFPEDFRSSLRAGIQEEVSALPPLGRRSQEEGNEAQGMGMAGGTVITARPGGIRRIVVSPSLIFLCTRTCLSLALALSLSPPTPPPHHSSFQTQSDHDGHTQILKPGVYKA